MKILLIHNYHEYWGGEETYITSLFKLLKKRGHKIYVYSKKSKDIRSFWDKIKTIVGFFYNPKLEKELDSIIDKFKPDIVQFQNIYPLITPLAYKICKKHKLLIFQRVSNYQLVCPSGLLCRNKKICELCVLKSFKYPAFIYGCYHRSKLASFFFTIFFYLNQRLDYYSLIDHYIFPTKFIRAYFIQKAKMSFLKSSVISTPILTTGQKRKSYLKQRNYFLYVGRLAEDKGIMRLLNVFGEMKLKLVLIGVGPLTNEVKYFSRHKNIIFKGFLEKREILNYMTNAIATIIPSISYDVLPNVLIESFSVGTPVLVPKRQNFYELVEEGKTGYFIDELNFKDKLSVIYKQRKKTSYMKKNIKKVFISKYLAAQHIRALINLYDKFKRKK